MATKRIENRAPGQREITWKDRSAKDWETSRGKTFVFPRATTLDDGKVIPSTTEVDEKIVEQWLADDSGDDHVKSLFDEKDGDLSVSASLPKASDAKGQASDAKGRPPAQTGNTGGQKPPGQ